MRSRLFDLVAWLGQNIIEAIKGVAAGLSWLIGFSSGIIVWLTANIITFLLRLIDHKKYNHISDVIEQAPLNNELEILANVTSVKEEALKRRKWTDEHTMALNRLGARLYQECDWSEENIHAYMRQVVESIPGLSYGAEYGDDDDDDGIDLDEAISS